MCVTDWHKRILLLLACITLPLLMAAQDNDAVRSHDLWDRAYPVNPDSTDEWWVSGSLVQRTIPAATINKLKADKQLQYDRPVQQRRPGALAKLLVYVLAFLNNIRVLLFILLIGALAWLIVYFMRQQGFRFSRSKTQEALPATDDGQPADAAAYEQRIQEAIAGGRFRQAIRYLYLQTLRVLADKQLITLSRDKTNADYLRVLWQTRYHQPFARLTLDYEYVWYGEAMIGAEQFREIHGQFRQFMSQVKDGGNG